MFTRTNIVRVIVVLVTTWVVPWVAVAQKAAAPKPQDKLALGENEVKQLLLLIDTDENGKISKQEWMKFMEAEFDRLDKDKKGQLDAKELTQSKLRVSHPVNVGK
jgi:EF hand